MTIPEQRFRELLAHAWTRSSLYRQIYTEHGIRERDLVHLALHELPVVSKPEVMVHFDEAVTDPRLRLEQLNRWLENDSNPLSLYLDEYVVIYSSGGSSIRSVVPCTPKEWQLTTTIAAPDILPAGSQFGSSMRSAFYFIASGHFASSTNASRASLSVHDVLWLTINAPLEETCAQLNAFQPERLTSYASTMTWLAEFTLEGKLHIRPRSVVVSGDRLTPQARSLIRRAWDAEIYDLYAGVESLYIAVRKPGGDHFEVFNELTIVEVVDESNRMVRPGESGRVLVTNLTNKTLPLIRFDLHDEAVLGRTGFGAESLETIHGKSQMRLPVRMSNGEVGHISIHELHRFKVDGCAAVQFVTHSPDHVELRYESPQNLDPQIEGAFRQFLAEASASVTSMQVRRVPRIQNDDQTKKRWDVVTPGRPVVQFLRLTDQRTATQTVPPVAGTPRIPIVRPCSIFHRFQEIASSHGNCIAVTDGELKVTYRECCDTATRIAQGLLHRGFDPSRPVGILSDHAPEVIAVVLGVVAAGGFYLPLDASVPEPRIRRILADTQPEYLLSSAAQEGAARTVAGPATSILHIQDLVVEPAVDGNLPDFSPETPACLLYTSGSTGTPKGIVFSHATVLNRVLRYSEDFRLSPDDRVSFLQSFAVSAGVRDMYGALLNGATLCLYDIRTRGVRSLPDWLNRNRISVFYAVPTIWRIFLENLSEETFPFVRTVRLGGEAMQPRDFLGFKDHFPDSCVLANGYASTEADTICQYFMNHQTSLPANRVPVGWPVQGVSMRILGRSGQGVDGSVGEISVRGGTLASGCWDPRKRKIAPLEPIPYHTGDLGYSLPDGLVFLTGRRDFIVKVSGHRVHLEEIEKALEAVPGVSEAAAIAHATSRGNAGILAYYVPASGSKPLPVQLRKAVEPALPGRAVPISFVPIATLPRLPGGKVNRSMLPEAPRSPAPAEVDAVYHSETELRLAGIWKEILGIRTIPEETDFFELGGDSIAAFRVLTRIQTVFKVDVPVVEFFKRPTIPAVAALIERRASIAEG